MTLAIILQASAVVRKATCWCQRVRKFNNKRLEGITVQIIQSTGHQLKELDEPHDGDAIVVDSRFVQRVTVQPVLQHLLRDGIPT